MYFINPHIPAYYFNRKKQTEPVDGKFTYCYPNGNKIEKYKVSPKVYKALKKRDKKEYYSDRRQFRLEKFYGNQPPLLQCVYVNMLSEVWRRVKMFPGVPIGENYYKADVVLAKIAKRLKITEDEFLCKRFFPFLSKARLERYEEFIKKYKH